MHYLWFMSRNNNFCQLFPLSWAETPPFLSVCDKVIEVTGEVKRRNQLFSDQDPSVKASGFYSFVN